MSLNIKINTIDHKKQRYETVGDWHYISGDNLNIHVSNMGDWRKEALVAIHEQVEALLCRNMGIKQDLVDDFDIEFEKHRKEGNTDEPGDDPKAPYKRQHFIATTIERILCAEFGLDWNEYEKVINSL